MKSLLDINFVKTKCKLLGSFNNNWRQRRVELYEHPYLNNKVVSIGYPFKNPSDVIMCEEDCDDYKRQIDYNDWSDYN